MGIIDKIKVLFGLKDVANDLVQEYKKDSATKPGWKTTEFWVHLVAVVPTIVGVVAQLVPAKWGALIIVASTAIYTISRVVIKFVAEIKPLIVKAVADIKAANAGQPVAVEKIN